MSARVVGILIFEMYARVSRVIPCQPMDKTDGYLMGVNRGENPLNILRPLLRYGKSIKRHLCEKSPRNKTYLLVCTLPQSHTGRADVSSDACFEFDDHSNQGEHAL